MKSNTLRIFFPAMALFALSQIAPAKIPSQPLVKVSVVPDHPDWLYKTGEKTVFEITVTRFGALLKDVKLHYAVGPERMEPAVEKDLILQKGAARIDGGTMDKPGFLRCIARCEFEGRAYEGIATAAFDPLSIKPTQEFPADFTAFWEGAKAEAAKVPLNPVQRLLQERCTSSMNVYEVYFDNDRPGSRIYGILCVPAKEGKYPALLTVPPAGSRPYSGDVAFAEKGVITLEIGIHGVPVTMDEKVYEDSYQGALYRYKFINLDSRDRYYFRRVFQGCSKAVDYLCGLPQFDGKKLAVFGGSQGGGLAIVTAALNPKVKWMACEYPGFCDLTGPLHGRAGGWPDMFDKKQYDYYKSKDVLETVKYFDADNFARLLKIPCLFAWGYNDVTCAPTSFYSAYNLITSPKKAMVYQDMGHWSYPEEGARLDEWLTNHLLGDGGLDPK
jgi:cephalosporin-C deacetylase-like acetyl esterase